MLQLIFLFCALTNITLGQNSQVGVPKIDLESLPNGLIEITWDSGVLQQSQDLTTWTDWRTSVSPLVLRPNKTIFYRAKVDSVVRVPIIAFTGQSNSIGNLANPNREPYLSNELPVFYAVSHTTAIKQDNTLVQYNSMKDAIGISRFGSSYEIATKLYESSWRSQYPPKQRFAILSTGQGGQPASLWRKNRFHYLNFTNSLRDTISHLNSTTTNLEFYLDTVIINQGEREVRTGVNWASSWVEFIDGVREVYGEDVDFIIEMVENDEIMGWSSSTPKIISNINKLRSQQLSIATTSANTLFKRDSVYTVDPDVIDLTNFESNLTVDKVHWNALGVQELGRLTFETFSEIKNIE